MKMKCLFTRMLSILGCMLIATDFCYAAEYVPAGNGSTDDPYQISSVDDLYWFAEFVNEGGDHLNACAELTANIVVNTLKFDDGGNLITEGENYKTWVPIWKQDWDNQYEGTFDGKGYTISGLYFDGENKKSVGLFGWTGPNSIIQNVGVVDSYFKLYDDTFYCIGSICGRCYGKIINCFSNSTIVAPNEYSYAGGICSEYNGEDGIYNCYFVGSISIGTGATSVGGICGLKDGKANFTNCFYLEGCCPQENNYGSAMTKNQFHSGEVAYLLNLNNANPVWGQDLTAENSLPTINGPQLYEKDGKYYNESNLPYDEYGICEFPLVTFYHPAELVDGVYKISNAGELCWFAQHVVNGGTSNACAELTADITFPNYGDRNWDPISEYEGTFDGKGHTISKVFCELSAENYVGLFRINNGTIKNLGIVDSYFGGKDYVGSFCGYNNGTIENCYSSSTYKGDENDGGVLGYTYVGGLCGVNEGTIKYCYNSGKVEASEDYVGGLCGANRASGKITSCFSTGIVIYYKETDASYGSLCGYNEKSDSINNCYTTAKSQYLNDYYGNESEIVLCKKCEIINTNYYLCDEDNGNGGKTEEQFHFGEVAYLLGQSDNVWGQDLTDENSLPGFNDHEVFENDGTYFTLNSMPFDENGIFVWGDSTIYQPAELVDGVYQISNAGELYWFANFVNGGNSSANAVLTNNIVVNANVLNEDGTLKGDNFVEWTPIGVSGNNQFTGVFNGQNYTISGLYLSNTEKNFVGLFGYIDNGATIQNLGVVDSYFEGYEDIGGLCGVNANGLIENCYSGCSVTGVSFVGGLCGSASTGTIKNSYNVGSVKGSNYAGGLCGENFATIENSYNVGSVTGLTTYTGGLCGENYSTIKNSYNVGVVVGKESVGGLSGEDYGTIENCHNTGAVSGTRFIGGVCGSDYGTIKKCYNTGVVCGGDDAMAIGGVCGNYVSNDITDSYNSGLISGGDKSAYVGGVCGFAYYITNCYNTGLISVGDSSQRIGGICGHTVGEIINCYNTGEINSGDETLNVGGVCGYNEGTIKNCYYLSGLDTNAVQMTKLEFANGTVAKLLHNADTVWGQNISIDTVPNFSGKIIFSLTLTAENGTISGEGGAYEYMSKVSVEAIPDKGYHFAGWNNGMNAKDTITIVSDTVLVATFEAHSYGVWDTTQVATCTAFGLRTHTCACGASETDTIHAIGHTFGEPAFAWTLDKTSVEGVVVCENDKTHTLSGASKEISTDTTKATCTEKGKIVYSAVVEINGKQYTLKDSVEIPAIGHKYGEPVFTWNDDYTQAIATFTCVGDDDKQIVEDVVVVSDTTIAPTLEKEGEITYTATATFNGKSYMDIQTASLEKIKGGELTSLVNAGSDSFVIYAYQNQIYVKSAKSGTLDVYDLHSRIIVKNVRYEEGITPVAILPKGIYVIMGKKVMVE